jgi:Spy/CpxP family protein refolding chaperone
MMTGKQFGAAALLVATFAVGVVTGKVSDRWGEPDRAPRAERRAPRQSGNGERRDFVSRLQRELDLTPAQRDSVKAIVKKWDPAMRSVWDGMRPKFDSLRALVHADIAQVLTDEQNVAFQRWIARMDSVTRKRSKEAGRARSEIPGCDPAVAGRAALGTTAGRSGP